jgi:hypothetical protein
MKKRLIFLAIFTLSFAAVAAAQNRVRLFDPVAISVSDYNMIANASPWGAYRSVQVYLSCPSGRSDSVISGPNGGDFIVDNALLINNEGICNGNCFTLTSDPTAFVGLPVENAYRGVAPVNVSRKIAGTGLYTFTLLDAGYSYGSTAVYLNTSCSIYPINTPTDPDPTPTPTTTPTGDTVICHRDNGNRGQTTLTVGGNAVASHLAHGDTVGPCGS